MRALRKLHAQEGAALVTVPDLPGPSAGEVMINVKAAGICGSDLHAIDWSSGYEFMTELLPLTLGHEFSGVVRTIGADVDSLSVGDRVTCWPTLACNSCTACKESRPQLCESRAIIGLHRNGAMAEALLVPARNCRKLPKAMPFEVGALAEPLSIAVNAVDQAQADPGDTVAVLGPGPIGLSIGWVAQQRGLKVLLAGFEDGPRLKLAVEMGLATCADLSKETLADAVGRCLGGPVDRVIEATGRAASVSDGLAVLRPGGILVAAGIHATPLTLDLTTFVRSKKQLRAAHDTTAAAFEEAINLLETHGSVLARLITHRLPLGRAQEAIALAKGRAAMKVLLLPHEETTEGING